MDVGHSQTSQKIMVNKQSSKQLTTFILDDNKITAGKARTVEVIVNVMKSNMDNANICYGGCAAVANITENNGKQT